MRLKGKVAIVTGAGSGFGAGIAKRFVEEGAAVWVVDLNSKNGSQVAKDLNARFLHADVTKGGDWAKLIQECTSASGRLDVVVNNAGCTATSLTSR